MIRFPEFCAQKTRCFVKMHTTYMNLVFSDCTQKVEQSKRKLLAGAVCSIIYDK